MTRKIPNGEIRNKERTKLKLINAVGEIIRNEGYTKLGVNNIANTADVNKKLIYRYFGSVDLLIETYVKNKDYWLSFHTVVEQFESESRDDNVKYFATDILTNLFEHLVDVPETQKILLWEISESSELMRDVSSIREKIGSKLFAMTNPTFENSNVDIRAIYSILLGGIYYLILHSNATGGSFCEIEIKTEKGKNRIISSLKDIVNWSFNAASKQ